MTVVGVQELGCPAHVAAVASRSYEPWPTLRVLADDDVEELLYLHESQPVSSSKWRRARPQAGVLILPTLDAPAGDYVRLASALSGAGLYVARAELRGQGHSEASLSSSSGYRELVERSIPAMFSALRRRWSELPIYVLGHGAGGQLACLYAAASAAAIEGVIVIGSSGADPLRERIAKLGRALWSDDQPRARLLDWARSGRRLCGSDRDWSRALARVRLPILSIALAEDRQSPPASVEALLARMPRARRHRVVIVGRQATHQGWLQRPTAVVEQICKWQRQPRNRTGPRVRIAPELLGAVESKLKVDELGGLSRPQQET